MSAAAKVVRRCRELAAISEEDGRLTRPFASGAMARANALVGGWMAQAGLDVRVDAAGNLVGRLAGSDASAGTLLLGSHLDSVRDAGAFDGPLGVLSALACIERLRAQDAALPFAIDVLGFSDEEGLRYGTAYLGSRALAGTFDPALLSRRDAEGVSLGDALRVFGDAPVASASRAGERLLGYCEVHIEQGPVLERRDLPVGVVSAIAGATRADVSFTGRAGHAGTVPMDARRDAACAAAEWVLAVEAAGAASRGWWRRSACSRRGRARPTSSPAARSRRSTCATPTMLCAARRWRRCAREPTRSVARAGWGWGGGRSTTSRRSRSILR